MEQPSLLLVFTSHYRLSYVFHETQAHFIAVGARHAERGPEKNPGLLTAAFPVEQPTQNKSSVLSVQMQKRKRNHYFP